MLTNIKTTKMDIGRLMILPVFALLATFNVINVYKDVSSFEPGSTIKVVTLIHDMLVACFYALVIYLYFIRSTAKATTRSLVAKVFALVSAFLPFAIPFLNSPSDNSGTLLSANLIIICGMIISLYSLNALGGSFSIIPQARTLVKTGPYQFVRHPLYSGEFISLMGIVLARFSISVMVIFCLNEALQIYRALQEERLLVDIFPEYESYSQKRARFIPGVF